MGTGVKPNSYFTLVKTALLHKTQLIQSLQTIEPEAVLESHLTMFCFLELDDGRVLYLLLLTGVTRNQRKLMLYQFLQVRIGLFDLVVDLLFLIEEFELYLEVELAIGTYDIHSLLAIVLIVGVEECPLSE